METKTSQEFLKNYYNEKKNLIDVIGFVGVITGLFLQITQFQNDSLRMIQALLLLTFVALLSYLLINFWIRFIIYIEETPKSFIFNSLILGMIIHVFIFYLIKFIFTSFNVQLKIIFNILKLGFILLISIYISDITKFLTQKFGKEKLWLAINEIFWGILIFLYIFDKKQVVFPVVLVLLNIPLVYKWISKKTFYLLYALVVVIYTLLNLFIHLK